jgi:ligand-binding sensor domain-containing protein/signal transduction histidine kinase
MTETRSRIASVPSGQNPLRRLDADNPIPLPSSRLRGFFRVRYLTVAALIIAGCPGLVRLVEAGPLECSFGQPGLVTAGQDRSLSEFRIDRWTTEDELPQNTIQCLLQTEDGYLWLGTQSGLARYDGLHFTVFDRNNTPAMKSDNILCLAEDSAHNLWVGTADGLLRRRAHAFAALSTATLGEGDPHVWALCARRQGGVWLGAGARVVGMDGEQVARLPSPQAGRICAVLEDVRGRLWAGTEAGLFRRAPGCAGSWVALDRNAHAEALTSDGEGRLWFGNERGLWQWKEEGQSGSGAHHVLACGPVLSMARDAGCGLWFIAGGRLNRWRDGQWVGFDSAGLPAGEFNRIYPDREGNLWLGTGRSGLVRLRPRRLVAYSVKDGLADDDVWSICEGRAGAMWFGTSHGVSRFADEQFTNYPNGSTPVLEDRSGTIWLKTRAEELAVLRAGKPEPFAPKEGCLFKPVFSIYQDRVGAVWVAVQPGLWRLHGGQCDLYALAGPTHSVTQWTDHELGRQYRIHANALPGPSAPVGILEDHAGDLWVGSKGGGLHRFHDGRFTTLTTNNRLTSDLIAPLLAEPDGTLWIGSDKGLNRLKNDQITRYSTAEGLAENMVGNLLEDDQGWFWTIGHHGIHRMRKQQLNELAEGRRHTVRTISYGEADGMLSSEANIGLFPNTHQSADGLLWFPTTGGVVVVDGDEMETHDRPPSVVLERVLADDQLIFGDPCGSEVQSGEGLLRREDGACRNSRRMCQLPAGRGRLLEFHYTANTFVAPEKVRFRYKLVGCDPDWRDVGTRRSAPYTNLKPGTYRFCVRAITEHGIESECPAHFAFSIAPYFYQTRWFKAALALGILLSGEGTHRVRVGILARRQTLEQQLALAHQRERIAKDMHDDLGASLTQISLLIDHARRDPANSLAVAADVEKIAETARHTAEAAEEIVWTVNPRHDSLDSVATYLCQLAREHLENTDIRLRLELADSLPDVPLPSDVRHNLVLFVKEAIHNAVKHSAARQVSVGLTCNHHTLVLSVADDGRGIGAATADSKPHRCSTGNGLPNMRQRIESIGGCFELRSQPGQGTTLQATVKLRRV